MTCRTKRHTPSFSLNLLSTLCLVVGFFVFSSCGTQDDPLQACEQVTCSSQGDCVIWDGEPACVCYAGYQAEGLDCVAEPCTGVSCSGHGSCAILDDKPVCICDQDFHPEGLFCLEDNVEDPCQGVNCSSHGNCALLDDQPVCICDQGYHPVDLSCIENNVEDPCEGVSCSGHGNCAVQNDQPVCICDHGYHAEELSCVEDLVVDPCQDVNCSGHGNCAIQNDQPLCVCDNGYHSEELSCVEDDVVDPMDRPVWFLHISDTHFGEAPSVTHFLNIFIEEIMPTVEPAATLHTGDVVDKGSTNYQWASYRSVIDGNLPAYPAYLEIPGNHDVKDDGTSNFLTNSHTGRAGGGMYGQSFADTSAGPVRIVRANTADSSVNLIAIAGLMGQDQTDDLLALPDGPADTSFSVVAAHHPIAGLEQLRLESASRMRNVIDHFGSNLYFCGHVHKEKITWVEDTLMVQASSLGKTDSKSFAIVSMDDTGPAAKFVEVGEGAIASVSWPVALITHPANTALGNDNPHALGYPPGQSGIKLRMIAFSPSGVFSAEMRVDDGAWVPMDYFGDHLWEASFTTPVSAGDCELEVRVTSDEGIVNDSIAIYVTD